MPVTPYTRVTCDLEGCGFSSDDAEVQAKFVQMTAEVAELGTKVEGVYCTKEHAQEAMNALPGEGARPAPMAVQNAAPSDGEDASPPGVSSPSDSEPEPEEEEDTGPEEATVVRAGRDAQSAWLRIPRPVAGRAFGRA